MSNTIDLSKLRASLKRYCFIDSGTLFFREIPRLPELAAALGVALPELESRWKRLFPKQSLPSATSAPNLDQLGELCLDSDLDFSALDDWDFRETLHHFLAARDSKPAPQKRPLVVALLGHVDHGKTSLLDALRSSSVTDRELGAITQRLAAYSWKTKSGKITLIDTPGHEFFEAMRRRGASLADRAILVVSGVEGVKEQTREAIASIREARIPLAVWINKKDRPGFNPERIRNELLIAEIVEGEEGTVFFEGSAKTKEGLDTLIAFLEKEAATSDRLQFRDAPGKAVVLDSSPSSFGASLTLLITAGRIRTRDSFLVASETGRIRRIEDDSGANRPELSAGETAVISGFSAPAVPGTPFFIFSDSSLPKRLLLDEEEALGTPESTEQIFDDTKHVAGFSALIKFGFIAGEEAFRQRLPRFENSDIPLRVIGLGTGLPTATELRTTANSKAEILLFQLKPSAALIRELSRLQIPYQEFGLIYNLWEYLEEKTRSPKISLDELRTTLGRARITNTFEHSKLGLISGAVVDFGSFVHSSDPFAVYRDGEVVAKNLRAFSMRTLREKVNRVAKGGEVGIVFRPKFAVEVGDEIEQYQEKDSGKSKGKDAGK